MAFLFFKKKELQKIKRGLKKKHGVVISPGICVSPLDRVRCVEKLLPTEQWKLCGCAIAMGRPDFEWVLVELSGVVPYRIFPGAPLRSERGAPSHG